MDLGLAKAIVCFAWTWLHGVSSSRMLKHAIMRFCQAPCSFLFLMYPVALRGNDKSKKRTQQPNARLRLVKNYMMGQGLYVLDGVLQRGV